jgi:hypothetical protein
VVVVVVARITTPTRRVVRVATQVLFMEVVNRQAYGLSAVMVAIMVLEDLVELVAAAQPILQVRLGELAHTPPVAAREAMEPTEPTVAREAAGSPTLHKHFLEGRPVEVEVAPSYFWAVVVVAVADTLREPSPSRNC